jgi:hypothetical protein
VYDRHSHERATLLAMGEACDNINEEQCQARIRHGKIFVQQYMNNEDIHCDADENVWPNTQDRLDANYCVINSRFYFHSLKFFHLISYM